MGGIIGKLSFEPHEALAHPVLEQMLAAVWHRGTYSRGIRTASGVALGWRGEEPLRDADDAAVASPAIRSVLAVIDAAPTCAPQLRAELIRAGRSVDAASDAALLAHAYDQWGDACIERLHGAFAVAIWDGRRRRLLLARDRAGTRPLFYALLPGHGVVFASTIRSLLQDPGVGREWSPAAIDAYLACGAVPAPLTPYERISKLEPAQRLMVEGRRLRVERYWTPSPCDGQFGPTLQQAVADQPGDAGILYTGGPSSAALIVCAPARRVVTVGVDQDTRDLARGHALAQTLGVEPILDIAAPDVVSLASDVASQIDEPSADPGVISQLAVFRTASRHLDRALAGHGAQALWSDRAPRPGPWPLDDRVAVYTRGFLGDASRTPAPRPATFDGLANAATLAASAGIELLFPHADPRLISLAANGRALGANPVRELVTRQLRERAGSAAPAGRRRIEYPWLRTAVNAMAPGLLFSGRFDGRGMLVPSALRRLWDEHRAGGHDHTHRLWSLLMLELWFRVYVDGGGMEMPIEYALARAA